MGDEDAWKPANLTTDRGRGGRREGGGPVEHSNPCRRTFAAIHYGVQYSTEQPAQYRTYPPRKHPQPMMQMCRKHRWNRNLHETSKPWMRFVHHTYAHTDTHNPLTFFIQPWWTTTSNGKRQRGLPGHSMQELAIPGFNRGLSRNRQALPIHCQASQSDSPLYNMRICASFSACLFLP